MKAVFQRVDSARVTAEGKTTGEIGPGALILLGRMPPSWRRKRRSCGCSATNTEK